MSMDSPASAARRPCFAVEDDGLASLAGINYRRSPFSSRIGFYGAAGSLPAAGYCSSPRFGRIFDPRFEEPNHLPHFLESCSLCKKPLGGNRDIFMYRGDMPFCSVDCRQEQIDMDEAREKSVSLSASMKAMRRKQKDSNENSSEKPQKYPFRAGAVAAG